MKGHGFIMKYTEVIIAKCLHTIYYIVIALLPIACSNNNELEFGQGIEINHQEIIKQFVRSVEGSNGCEDIIKMHFISNKSLDNQDVRSAYCEIINKIRSNKNSRKSVNLYKGSTNSDSRDLLYRIEYEDNTKVSILIKNDSIESIMPLSKGDIIIGWV